MSDSEVIGVFARANHPKGWGHGCDQQGYGKAHGYSILLVSCQDDDELVLVEDRLRDWHKPFYGIIESGQYSDGYLGEWFGGLFDLIAKLNAPEHSIVVGPWQPEPQLIVCKGDNRLVAQFTAEQVLGSPSSLVKTIPERHHAYGHDLLNGNEQTAFLLSSSRACPVEGCGEYMTQQENPIRSSDSWWFTCPNKHATWIGK